MSMEARNAETGAAYRRLKVELENDESVQKPTIEEIRKAKVALEKEIARLLKEFGNSCECEVSSIYITSMMRSADSAIPLGYLVEAEVTL